MYIQKNHSAQKENENHPLSPATRDKPMNTVGNQALFLYTF